MSAVGNYNNDPWMKRIRELQRQGVPLSNKPMVKPRKLWDESKDQQLRQMFHEGRPYKEIELEMGYSERSIRNHLKQLGLKRYENTRSYTDEELQDIKAKLDAGMSLYEIAKNSCRTYNGLLLKINRMKWRIPTQAFDYWTATEDKILTEMFHQGKGFDDIAKAVGRSREAVKKRAWRQLNLMRVKPWTCKEVKDAYQMKEQGLSHRQIGEKLGRTLRAVSSMFAKRRRLEREKNGFYYE